jgi:hypothetical protein
MWLYGPNLSPLGGQGRCGRVSVFRAVAGAAARGTGARDAKDFRE